jgi:F-type H+-transporting ATPase subunit a
MLFNPLEQFEIHVLLPLRFFGIFDISFTNYSLTLLFVLGFIALFFVICLYRLTAIPTHPQAMAEMLYKALYSLLKQQAGQIAHAYFPIVFTLFIFILFSNLFGLIPFGFTVTAQFILTLSLAFSLNFGLIIIGFIEHGVYFLKKFIPSGTPMWLLPGLSVIEVVSYLIRTISLSVRLFANMLAGHALMHIISSAFVNLVAKAGYLAILLSTVVILAVMVLETGIAFLQAYVFVVLFCIYLSESLEISH